MRPRIVDPKAVPVSGTDAHLPPVLPHQMTPQALRTRFAVAADWAPEIPATVNIRTARPRPLRCWCLWCSGMTACMCC